METAELGYDSTVMEVAEQAIAVQSGGVPDQREDRGICWVWPGSPGVVERVEEVKGVEQSRM